MKTPLNSLLVAAATLSLVRCADRCIEMTFHTTPSTGAPTVHYRVEKPDAYDHAQITGDDGKPKTQATVVRWAVVGTGAAQPSDPSTATASHCTAQGSDEFGWRVSAWLADDGANDDAGAQPDCERRSGCIPPQTPYGDTTFVFLREGVTAVDVTLAPHMR